MPPVHSPLPENSVPMGDWMRINGDGIYGSSAWKVFGEGADGVMNVLPGGSIGRWQANIHSIRPICDSPRARTAPCMRGA